MKLTKTNKVIEEFSKVIEQRAKARLKDNIYQGKLQKSIDVDADIVNDKISIHINMEDYGTYVDEGVKGREPKLVKNGRQKAANSRFSFKLKKPPMQPLMDWAKAKNIRLRNSKGQFAKGDYRTIGFILQSRIHAQGLKPVYFITEPIDDLIEKFSINVSEAYAEDFIDSLL